LVTQILNHHLGHAPDKHFVVDNQDYGHQILSVVATRVRIAKVVRAPISACKA